MYWTLFAATPGQSIPTKADGFGVFDWSLLDGVRADAPERFAAEVLLAGGLDPDSAPEAAALGPFALDLSSGVERVPGDKDHEKIEQLFRALRRAPGSRNASGGR